MSLPQCRQQIAQCIRVARTVTGSHDVHRIFAALEKTDVRRCAGQVGTIPLQCKSVVDHFTPSSSLLFYAAVGALDGQHNGESPAGASDCPEVANFFRSMKRAAP